MSSTVVTGIAELVTCDGSDRRRARASSATPPWSSRTGMSRGSVPRPRAPMADRQVDVGGRAVLPGFVDSHSHLVFAGDRGDEFAARMAGTPYDGGGIGVSVAATRAATDDELRALVAARVAEMRAQGTTTVEIKSGYGLTVEDEARALRIAREFTPETTFLGAHVVPREYAGDRAAYLELVTGPMLEAAAPHARWVDVFCEPHSAHAFTEDEARAVLRRRTRRRARAAGARQPARPRARACSSPSSSGRPASTTAPTSRTPTSTRWPPRRTPRWRPCCPGWSSRPARPTRMPPALLRAGVSIALATDCNPGTCYSSSMPFVIALAVREMGLTPGEAVLAATVGSAKSLRRNDIGRIDVGRAGRPHRPRRAVARPPVLPRRRADRAGPRPGT